MTGVQTCALPISLLMAAAVLSGALLRRALRKPAGFVELTGWSAGIVVALLVLGFVSLRRLYPDQRYRGDSVLLQAMRSELESASANSDTAVFLNNRTYFDFMLNYFKGPAVWYTLELNPKELVAPGAQRPAPNIDPFDILNLDAWTPVDFFGRQHAQLFLLMESGPYTPNVTRALEWAMNTDMHRVRALEFSNEVRLLEFSTSKAPARAAPPEFALEYRMGNSLVLRGYDANPPAGLVNPGSIINVSTQWQAGESVPAALAIGTYLMNPQGGIAFQDDSVPVGGFWPWMRHLILPSVALGLAYVALIARITRASMLEVLSEDYIRTANAKGLATLPVLLRHALQNAAVPIVTVVGIGIALLISGVVITETVFNIPGIGRLVVDAIARRDYPIIQGAMVVFAGIYVLINLLVDLSYGLLDPRIRYH